MNLNNEEEFHLCCHSIEDKEVVEPIRNDVISTRIKNTTKDSSFRAPYNTYSYLLLFSCLAFNFTEHQNAI